MKISKHHFNSRMFFVGKEIGGKQAALSSITYVCCGCGDSIQKVAVVGTSSNEINVLCVSHPVVHVPIYFRFCKLHPISYPPSLFHSPCFISSSDPACFLPPGTAAVRLAPTALFIFSASESLFEYLHNFRF